MEPKNANRTARPVLPALSHRGAGQPPRPGPDGGGIPSAGRPGRFDETGAQTPPPSPACLITRRRRAQLGARGPQAPGRTGATLPGRGGAKRPRLPRAAPGTRGGGHQQGGVRRITRPSIVPWGRPCCPVGGFSPYPGRARRGAAVLRHSVAAAPSRFCRAARPGRWPQEPNPATQGGAPGRVVLPARRLSVEPSGGAPAA